MKAIIYYSLSGNTKQAVEERYKGDFYRLQGKIKIPRNYILQLAYLGMFATLNSKLKYHELDINFDQYDEVVLASPVWAFTIVPFLKKFLRDNHFQGKSVTLLVTHEGGPGKVMKRFKRFVPRGNEIVQEHSIRVGSKYEDATIFRK